MKHALKNAMIPIITLVGTELGYMLTGSMLIREGFLDSRESVSWPLTV